VWLHCFDFTVANASRRVNSSSLELPLLCGAQTLFGEFVRGIREHFTNLERCGALLEITRVDEGAN
jgi:hypothetical protein